jgi:hypothetical protein
MEAKCETPQSTATTMKLRRPNNKTFDENRFGQQASMKSSFFPLTLTDWSNIDEKIRQAPSLDSFNIRLKKAYRINPVSWYYHYKRTNEIIMAKLRANALPRNEWLQKRTLRNSKRCL